MGPPYRSLASMYQSLDALPKRLVIDTNVLLNAAFVPDCTASVAIRSVKAMGYAVILDSSVDLEARKILRRISNKRRLSYDPNKYLDSYISTQGLISVPANRTIASDSVNRADRHVYAAANNCGAWILTSDVKFAAELQKSAVKVRLPWDVVIAANINDGKALLRSQFRVTGLSRNEGSLFARVIPDWASENCKERYAICEVSGVGKLYYDAGESAWVLDLFGGKSVSAKCSVKPEEGWMVCGCYSRTGGTYNVTIRADSDIGTSAHNSIQCKLDFTNDSPGSASLGHFVDISGHWNGWIKKVLIYPKAMTKKTWSALRMVPESEPDPASGNILEASLIRASPVGGGLILPAQRDFQSIWIS